MNVFRITAVALGLALGVATAPAAKADVIFTFQQTGATPGQSLYDRSFSGLDATGYVVLTDEGFANGVHLRHRSPSLGFPDTETDGLKGLFFSVQYGGVRLDAGLDKFFPSPQHRPGSGFYYSFALDSAPGGLLTGSVMYNNSETDFRFNLGSPLGTGETGSDMGGGCFGRCAFTGVTLVSVPEPASVALFGAGLLGMAAVRRRRDRRA